MDFYINDNQVKAFLERVIDIHNRKYKEDFSLKLCGLYDSTPAERPLATIYYAEFEITYNSGSTFTHQAALEFFNYDFKDEGDRLVRQLNEYHSTIRNEYRKYLSGIYGAKYRTALREYVNQKKQEAIESYDQELLEIDAM